MQEMYWKMKNEQSPHEQGEDFCVRTDKKYL